MDKNIRIGAIRWDAWVGNFNHVGLEVENCLSNHQYYNRLPFYADLNGDTVKIRCTTKEILKREINYASNANIDYFAFCWYPFNSGLDIARNLFLEINQNRINWCIILGTNPFTKEDALWLIKQFNSPNYEKINNRPIIYLFDVKNDMLDIIKFIRKNSKKYIPYFIGMVWNKKQAIESTNILNLDAISQYCTPGKNNMDYQSMCNNEEKTWSEYLEINNVVPWITTGWDKRPRYNNPVSWEDCTNFNNQYIQNPTNIQLQKHIENAIMFNLSNSDNSLILIYAWNEFDEGGYIEPTISNNNSINTEKLDAIKKATEIINK